MKKKRNKYRCKINCVVNDKYGEPCSCPCGFEAIPDPDIALYEMLRQFHSELKGFMFFDVRWKTLKGEQQNALEALHSVLYLVEGHFINF